MTVAVIAVTILLIFVIPVFEDMFSQAGVALPAPTQFVITLSGLLPSLHGEYDESIDHLDYGPAMPGRIQKSSALGKEEIKIEQQPKKPTKTEQEVAQGVKEEAEKELEAERIDKEKEVEKLDGLREAFSKVDAVIINDSEARMLTGERDIMTAAEKVLDMGPDTAIIKRGEYGALLFDGDAMFAMQQVDDFAVLMTLFAAVDPHHRHFALNHNCLASMTPAYAAPIQATTLSSMLVTALP